MIKLVMFDFDGVLVDSNEAWADIYDKAAKATGLEKDITYDQLRQHYGKPYIEVLRAGVPELVGDEKAMDEMYKSFVELASSEDFVSSFRSIKGLKNSLANLKKRFKLAVGSGNTKRSINRFLHKLGLHEYFDLVVAGDEVSKGKPDPDMLIKAMEHFRVRPEEAVYVGDAKADIIAAKRAGIASIAVLTGALSKEEAEELDPDYIVDDATKVPEVLACMS
ncbi:MAG: HAD family hydrolase [Candidatus Aenigmatarchaeota archaeon]|nr:MAG: HAD family hydrolase [Candidatus Aenigmarchaeota archaeon]